MVWLDMFTLSTFYRSKVWEKLITNLRLERLDSNGQLICQYCHKPISKKYDAIAHHTVFLTEENVNDFEISLNPELIQFVHHSCHNRIHNKLSHSKREVFLVYGSPLSGKTTYVESVRDVGDLIIDIDNIWECVSGCGRYIKPPRLKSVVFKTRNELMDCVKYRVGKWNNAYIIGGFPQSAERERLCGEHGAREIYIESTKEECLKRLEADEHRDKDEWTEYIEEWWNRFTPQRE